MTRDASIAPNGRCGFSLPSMQLPDVGAVPPEQQRGDRHQHPRGQRVAEEIESAQRHQRGRRERGERGNLEADRHRRARSPSAPGQAASAAHTRCPRRWTRLCRRRSRGTPDTGGRGTRPARRRERPSRARRRVPAPCRRGNRKPSLAAVADEREQRGRLVAGAQHVGGAGVAGAVLVRIGQAERVAHDDGKRNRPQQIGGDDDECGGDHDVGLRLESAVDSSASRLSRRAMNTDIHPRPAPGDAHRRLRLGAASAADHSPRPRDRAAFGQAVRVRQARGRARLRGDRRAHQGLREGQSASAARAVRRSRRADRAAGIRRARA